MKQKHFFQLGLLLWGLSLLLLIPGLTQPLLYISGSMDKQQLAELGKDIVINNPNMVPMFAGMVTTLIDNLELSGQVAVYEKTRSILGTVADLWRSGDSLVAILIVTFSVIIPTVKAALVLTSLLGRSEHGKDRALKISSAMSKWSMADVFVMATIVAYLAVVASGQQGAANLLSFEAEFGSGFWFFLGFCLLSVLSSQLMLKHVNK